MKKHEIDLIEQLIDAKILEYHWIQSMKSSYAEEKTKEINQIKKELEGGGGGNIRSPKGIKSLSPDLRI